MRTEAPRRVTAADVARVARTSTAVVSYVLNDGPKSVAPATRDRVLAAVAELGYRPNRIARALRSRRTGIIGLVVPGTSDPFFVHLAHSVEAAASARGYLTLIGNSAFDAAREEALIAGFVDERVDGIVMAGLGQSHDLRSVLDGADVPIVFLHNRPGGMARPLVTVGNEEGAVTATTHLLEHGHRRVACLTHVDDMGPVGERFRGWRSALQERGVRVTKDLVVRSGVDRRSASEAAARWLVVPNRPTALFAATDELAIGVFHAASRLGLKLPDDLAVVGFDGTDEGATTVPELSTVAEPFEELGARAVEILLANGKQPSVTTLATRFVPRRSCGC